MPRVKVSYRPNDELLVYGLVSRVYRVGGANTQTLLSTPGPFLIGVEQGCKLAQTDQWLADNASRLSHLELDSCEELDSCNAVKPGQLREPPLDVLPDIKVLGGCCGTDHRNVQCIAQIDAADSVA